MRKFDIGRAVSRTFQLMRDGLGSAGLLVALTTIITQIMNFGVQGMLFGQVEKAKLADPAMAPLALFGSPWYWASIVIALVVGAVAYGGSIAGYAKLARGQPTDFADCLSTGFARALPVVGLLVLWWIGISLGFLLLIVPGILLIVIWSAALPALVVDKVGVFESFGRSRSLTKGSRLQIFLFLLVLVVLLYLPMAVFGTALLGGGTGMLEKMASGAIPIGLMVGAIVYGWVIAMLINAGLASLHHELSEVAGTASSPDLIDVFN